MNIAHLLPYSACFPLTKHHGRYEWAHRLARSQAAGSHTVTIYAAPKSRDNNSKIVWKSSNYDFTNKTFNNIALVKTALQDSAHDIYHSHFDHLHYFLADSTEKPIIYTQHWFPNADIASAVRFNKKQSVLAVPATRYMAEEDDKLGIPHTEIVHQGIDLQLFTPTQRLVGNRLIL